MSLFLVSGHLLGTLPAKLSLAVIPRGLSHGSTGLRFGSSPRILGESDDSARLAASLQITRYPESTVVGTRRRTERRTALYDRSGLNGAVGGRHPAVAAVFTGLAVANVLGVPLGTFLGQALGWRSTFWAISVTGVLAFSGIAALVPADHPDRVPARLRDELGAFRSSQVWLSLAITALGLGGMFGAFSYIAFTLTLVSGFGSGAVPWLLVLFGAGLVVGNGVGGRLADRSVDGTLRAGLAGLTVVMVLFALLAASPIAAAVALLAMGALAFAGLPAMQTRVMRHAGEASTLASGANVAAANLGNAIGAAAGGASLTLGFGYTGPLWTGAGMALLATAVASVPARRNTAL